jgi:hypothetical protein
VPLPRTGAKSLILDDDGNLVLRITRMVTRTSGPQ